MASICLSNAGASLIFEIKKLFTLCNRRHSLFTNERYNAKKARQVFQQGASYLVTCTAARLRPT